jgi:hypothetical protein
LQFFWEPGADATAYTADLNACYTAIKAVTPGAFILGGALSRSTTFTGSISPTDFVTTMYSQSAEFDGISMHPYTYPYSLSSGNQDNGWVQMANVRSIMVSNGDTAKPIWITEYGAPTCGPGVAMPLDYVGETGNDYMTIPAQKALADQVIADLPNKAYIQKVFWYTLIDSNSNNPSTRENCFGSLYSSGNAKPAWTSLRSN